MLANWLLSLVVFALGWFRRCCSPICEYCDAGTTPTEVVIAISGVIDDNCTCSGLDGSYTLTRLTTCSWAFTSTGGVVYDGACRSQDMSILAEFDGTYFTVTLTSIYLAETEIAIWRVAHSDSDCCSFLADGGGPSIPIDVPYLSQSKTGPGFGCDFSTTTTVTADCTL